MLGSRMSYNKKEYEEMLPERQNANPLMRSQDVYPLSQYHTQQPPSSELAKSRATTNALKKRRVRQTSNMNQSIKKTRHNNNNSGIDILLSQMHQNFSGFLASDPIQKKPKRSTKL